MSDGNGGFVDARTLLQRYGLRAKKSWGQNFLVDERAYRAIVDAAGAAGDDWVIEIGAGLGTLTARLAAAAGQVIAVERERDMVAILHAELGTRANLEIAEANALTFDYAAVAARAGRPVIVVGNLPYQIASPILFRLLEARAAIQRLVVMLQKEMADRVVAKPATPEYGALSVMVQLYGAPRLVCRVRAGGFVPAPRVDSAVVQVTPYPGGAAVPVRSTDWFSAVVHAAFGQRRKMLRNALRALIDDDARLDGGLRAAAIDGARRGETLSVAEFARLADALHI